MIEPLDAETIELLDTLGFMMEVDGERLRVRFRDTEFVEEWVAADGLTEAQLVGREVISVGGRLFVLIEGATS